MIKQITKPFIWTWEKLKQAGRWVKGKVKKLLIWTGIVGVASAATLMIPKDTSIPSVEVNGRVIEFPYTDDNSNENLLIYTDKETYSNGEYVYMAIKNEGTKGLANLQFFFDSETKEAAVIEMLEKDIPYQVSVPEYKTVKYDCSYTKPANATTSESEEYIEKECEKQEISRYEVETKYHDIWTSREITDFSKEDNDVLVNKIKEKPKKDYKAHKKSEIELLDDWTYCRAKLKAPMMTDGEFFIEVIGDDIYGHLDPFLSGWDLRIQFDVPPTNIDAELTHFPILLTLGTSVGTGSTDVSAVFDELTSDGNSKKIAVTKADEETQVFVEIEKWDDANETANLWVSSTSTVLSNSATTTFYLYYDSDHADNTTYVGDAGSRTEVWDSNYKAVYHMADGVDASHIYDSTSNDNDGTKTSGKESTEIDGQIGKAQDFATDGRIDVAADASLDNDYVTMSVWAESDIVGTSYVGSGHLLNKLNTNAGNYAILVKGSIDSVGSQIRLDGDEGNIKTADVNNTLDTSMYKYDVTYDGSTLKIYVDGVIQTDTASASGTIDKDNSGILSIGGHPTVSTVGFDGTIDEVRVSSSARLASWIKAEYYTETDALISWGSEEEAPAAGTNMKINISDSWKDVSEIKINIGDSWKDVVNVWINVGDSWKVIY